MLCYPLKDSLGGKMDFSIKIKAKPDDQHCIFSKSFNTSEEFKAVTLHCINRRRIGFFESTLITVRTNNLGHFCKDFFLPTLINQALKANDIALKILMTSICLVLDLCTLPLRLITIVPRHFYNNHYQKHNHPLYKYLLNHAVTLDALKMDHVYLERELLGGSDNETFNFIQLPKFESPIRKEFIRRTLILAPKQ